MLHRKYKQIFPFSKKNQNGVSVIACLMISSMYAFLFAARLCLFAAARCLLATLSGLAMFSFMSRHHLRFEALLFSTFVSR